MKYEIIVLVRLITQTRTIRASILSQYRNVCTDFGGVQSINNNHNNNIITARCLYMEDSIRKSMVFGIFVSLSIGSCTLISEKA